MCSGQVLMRVKGQSNKFTRGIFIVTVAVGTDPDAAVLCLVDIADVYTRQQRPVIHFSCRHVIRIKAIAGSDPPFAWYDLCRGLDPMVDKEGQMPLPGL